MESSKGVVAYQEARVPLLEDLAAVGFKEELGGYEEDGVLFRRVWIESKKLWNILGPAILSRVTTYSMFVITQAFAGHLGDLELAAISFGCTVILGFDLGLMVL